LVRAYCARQPGYSRIGLSQLEDGRAEDHPRIEEPAVPAPAARQAGNAQDELASAAVVSLEPQVPQKEATAEPEGTPASGQVRSSRIPRPVRRSRRQPEKRRRFNLVDPPTDSE